MRDPKRIDRIIEQVRAYWKRNPELRLAQIVGNAWQDKTGQKDPYHMEDDDLEKYLKTRPMPPPKPTTFNPQRKYIQGDLVIEFDLAGLRCAVCVPEDECTDLVARLKRNDPKAWARIDELHDQQNPACSECEGYSFVYGEYSITRNEPCPACNTKAK